jgi:hypothetical protein
MSSRCVSWSVSPGAVEGSRSRSRPGLAGLDEHQVRRWASCRGGPCWRCFPHAPHTVIAAREHSLRPVPDGLIELTCNEIRLLFVRGDRVGSSSRDGSCGENSLSRTPRPWLQPSRKRSTTGVLALQPHFETIRTRIVDRQCRELCPPPDVDCAEKNHSKISHRHVTTGCATPSPIPQ